MQKTKVSKEQHMFSSMSVITRLLCTSSPKELTQHHSLKTKIVIMGVESVLTKQIFNYTVTHLKTQTSKWI